MLYPSLKRKFIILIAFYFLLAESLRWFMKAVKDSHNSYLLNIKVKKTYAKFLAKESKNFWFIVIFALMGIGIWAPYS